MTAYLQAVQYHLPSTVVTNEQLVEANPSWKPEDIYAKTGIRTRRYAAKEETAADLGFEAARALLTETGIDAASVDALLFCTQSPDYPLPTTACVLQQRLGLPTTTACFDYNLGCSGFTYGLWLARALILSESCRNVLLVLADTYSKYCAPADLATTSIFGDAGAAALLTSDKARGIARIGPTVLGTDGRGAQNLIVRAGGARTPPNPTPQDRCLFMNGPEIFAFTLTSVRSAIGTLLARTSLTWDQVDWFMFHQANGFMLEKLRSAMKIPESKMPIALEDVGNTVCATIPCSFGDRSTPAASAPARPASSPALASDTPGPSPWFNGEMRTTDLAPRRTSPALRCLSIRSIVSEVKSTSPTRTRT